MIYSKFDGFSSISSQTVKLKDVPSHLTQHIGKFKKGKEPDEIIIPGMVAKAKSLGMFACGLTDHGTMAGVIEMLKTCRKEKIRPVLGIEFYFSRNHKCHDNKGQPEGRAGNTHLNIFAKNFVGYQNLCMLAQTASLEGTYYNPRIDFELLETHREGLMCSSACLNSLINDHLLHDRYDKAKIVATTFKDLFGDDFYLEMHYHGLTSQAHILPGIQKLGKELDIKVVVAQDAHYLEKSDAEFHEVLMCLSTEKCIKDPKRLRFPYPEFYFKSQDEMYKIFNHVPKYLTNTLEIAEKCDYSDFIFVEDGGPMRLPQFSFPPEFKSPHEYLTFLAKKGLKEKQLDKSEEHVKRLQQELDDIYLTWKTKRYDFATYFLIVWDIMFFAKSKNIYGGIRGSGYGALINYCLHIIDVDPVFYGLLWERFLGYTDKYFISQEDFGIDPFKTKIIFAQNEEKPTDATGVMFDRYH